MTTTRLNKLCIYGSRDISLGATPVEDIDSILEEVYPDIEFQVLITGKGGKADAYGEKWAKVKGLTIKQFPARWKEFGKVAGPHRNEKMARECTHGLGLWDGYSRGTANMAAHLALYRKKNRIIIVDALGANLDDYS